ncbi:hypothetical protein M9458_032350 [Cirrhinus mrigala]|uniref:IRG-type G domain-containing protein n=1 Tax=Cirrhinus mrigala TaxID=683832 RepID=A0ABD0PD88_CIRMR
MESQDPAVAEAVNASGESNLEKATAKAKEAFDQLMNVSLNIAVTGKTGSGKSTFINAFRGLDEDDDEAARTGVTETTMEPIMYEHPGMPNVKIWDLPGIGSPNFKANKYLKDVKFHTYDFFIIISSERFLENDVMLAKEIKKQNKDFYFIRSKIDNDIRAEQRKKGFDEQNVLCKKKIKMFQGIIWAASLASAGIAVVPVPGLSAACDAGMVVLFFTRCYYAFGLDDRSLKRLSERVNKPLLEHVVKSKLASAVREKAVARVQVSVALASLATIEYAASLLPVVGSAAAAGISFGTTYYLLKEGLNELADIARKIRKEAELDTLCSD